VGAKALEAMQISLEATRQQVESIIGRGQNPVGDGHIPFTPRAKKVLELSLHESLRRQVIQLLTGHQGRPPATATIGDDLGDRLAAMAARLAAIDRKLGEAGAEG